MKKKKIIITALAAMVAIIAAAGLIGVNTIKVQTKMIDSYTELTLKDVPQEKWDALSKKTIFFGHMSVGFNILDGVKDILSENPNITLNITDTQTAAAFCHAQLGSNTQPLVKITSFQSQMQQLETPPDIAFLKFCYVDFYATTDTAEVFDAYQKMIAELQAAFPETTFMHCTVPLTTAPQDAKRKVKEIIKSLLGKTTTVDHNKKRMEFAALIKQAYPAETIIDITAYESTTPNGNLHFKTKNGIMVPFLIDDYTTDGGHLNEPGRQRVAEQMLIQLANGPDKS